MKLTQYKLGLEPTIILISDQSVKHSLDLSVSCLFHKVSECGENVLFLPKVMGKRLKKPENLHFWEAEIRVKTIHPLIKYVADSFNS